MAATAAEPVVEVSELNMSFGDITALAVVRLVVSSATVTALTGPNGAGKSTLLLIVAGLLKPTEGTIRVANDTPGSVRARQRVSFVPDQPALFDDLTLQDQLRYVARLHERTEPTEECRDLIEALGVEELLRKFPRAMSKGQRQKAALVVGVSRPFELLLLDEPTTALDASSRTALVEVLGDFASGGIAVVSSTHDRELIEAADTELRLVDGVLVDSELGG